MVFPTFFKWSLNFAIRSSWSEPQSTPGLVSADCMELLHLWLKEHKQSDFGIDRLVMSMCRVISFVVEKMFDMTGVFSWQNSVGLCPASFCTPRPKLPVIPGIPWLFTFAFQPSLMKRTSFLVLVLECVVGLHRTNQLQFLWHQWLGYRFGLLCCWMVCLGNELRSLCHFWDFIQGLCFELLLTMRSTPFFLRDSCPQE